MVAAYLGAEFLLACGFSSGDVYRKVSPLDS